MGSIGRDGSFDLDVKKPNARTEEHFQNTFHFQKGSFYLCKLPVEGKCFFFRSDYGTEEGQGGRKKYNFPLYYSQSLSEGKKTGKRAHMPLENLKMVQFQVCLPFDIQ